MLWIHKRRGVVYRKSTLINHTPWDDFSQPKICWNRIASIKEFSLVEGGIYISDSMHFIIGKELDYICKFLNSKIIQWLLSIIIGEAAGGNAGNAANVLNLHLIPNLMELDDYSICRKYGLNNEETEFICTFKI